MSLSKRDAALRWESLGLVSQAQRRLGEVVRAIMYGHPRRAIQRIEQQEARLRRAKAALRKWGRGGRNA